MNAVNSWIGSKMSGAKQFAMTIGAPKMILRNPDLAGEMTYLAHNADVKVKT